MTKKELVKDKVNLPANIDLESLAGQGMENVTMKDMSIPFLKILQDLSPEIKKSKAEYIEGAEPGLICNTVSSKLFKAVKLVPCFYQFVVNEWKPNRGGYVATHFETDLVVKTATRTSDNKLITKGGNELVDTANWYVLIQDEEGNWSWGVIAFTVTQLKKSRKMMSQLQAIRLEGKNGAFNPPLYTHIINASTSLETKDNNEWFGWKLELDQTKTYEVEGLFEMAVAYHDAVKNGLVKAVPPAEEGAKEQDIY